jgi:outer membrane protein TolC
MKYITLLTLCLIVTSLTWAQDTLSLQRAIEIGMDHNYNIKIAENDLDIAENNYTLGNAGFLPTVDVLASRDFEVQDSELDFASGEGQSVNGARSSSFGASAILNWTIFDGTRMFITYDRLAEIKQASAVDAQITIENTLADISTAYYTVILEQERVSVLQNSVDLSAERLRLARTQYEVGKASKLEFLAAQVDYNADTSALIRQREQLFNAKINLNTLMARDPEIDFEVPDQIDANLELQIGELKDKALSSNPSLLLARRNQNISNLLVREIQAERLPQVSVNLGYNYNSSEAEAGFVLGRQSNGVAYGVSARMNLFDGLNRTRRIQNARVNLETSAYVIEQTRLQLQAQLEQTFVSYTNSIQLLELETENFAIAKENADIALERYRLGKSNALELREAQINAVEAESRLIDAIYTTKIAEIELLRLSGQIMQPA